QTTGKEPSDLLHRKKTLPVIYAWEHAGPEDRERLARFYATTDPSTADVTEVIDILERSGAREYTRDRARRYRDEALAELDAAGVVKPAARARLEEIIVSVISA
ncbi:MAG: geranylgeranyl diphosphate synthase, type, partial [Chloroflexota bacterium]|nr:geranylgeranyl diphosphate synthase, type [Chloroflexota bacterium]